MDFMYTETAERLPKCVRGGGDSNKKGRSLEKGHLQRKTPN